ncbi:MAG: penicillin-binding transpeptidase domain-containing protein, partial [Actinomycetota bacterium]|nr:penicillin-binding transpeptidase domain-containing protein [Actinomycetota bacterium]
YGTARVFGGGLRVYTSIDLELQRRARDAIAKWLRADDGPSAALVAIDPRDGRLLAMVGGRNYRKSQFNLAVQGERQPGSAFKPFVLATALSMGISPQTTFESKPTVINLGDKLWSVENYEGSYLGTIDLVDATTYSDNAVYAQLTALVGPRNVRRMAHELGVASPLDDYFAIGLGAEAVNPLEMARAFSTFANGGARVDGEVLGNRPRAVVRVVDGDRVERNAPVEEQILDPNDAATMNAILENVVEEGTGERAALADRPAAGKTGTTENYGDAWFVGYTPQLAVAVWVGYPNKLVPMLTEFHGAPVAGGTYPALIWKTFALEALRYLDEPPEYFPAPEYRSADPVSVVRRNGEWLRDNGNCRDAHELLYASGFEPEKQASCKPNEVDVPRVIGATVAEAEERLARQPLAAEVVSRPAEPGERVGIVVDQYPRSGTLSSWDTVRLVTTKAIDGIVPRLVGLPLARAQALLARRRLIPIVESLADGNARIVLAQSPRGGLAAAPNRLVKLRVGRRG